METFLTELAKSGPWALVAGFLLWQVIKAWNTDRASITTFLNKMEASLGELTTAVRENTRVLQEIADDRPHRRT